MADPTVADIEALIAKDEAAAKARIAAKRRQAAKERLPKKAAELRRQADVDEKNAAEARAKGKAALRNAAAYQASGALPEAKMALTEARSYFRDATGTQKVATTKRTKAVAIPVPGVVAPNDRREAFDPRNKVPVTASPTIAPEAAAPTAGGGMDIRAIQKRLRDAGYNIKVDGVWGPKSKAAWTKFTNAGGSMSTGAGGGGGKAGSGGVPGNVGSSIEGDGVAPAPAQMGAGPVGEADLKLEVQRNYGYLAAYFDHPEIGPILKDAATAGWDESRLMGALFKTNWWQQTSATARQFDALKATDPAEASRRVDVNGRIVKSVAGQLGLALTPDRVNQIATTYSRLGWNAEDLQAALGNEFSYTPGQPYGGDMGKAISRYKQLASEYMVPVDEQTAFTFAQKWMRGEADEDNTEQYLRTQAISRFPQLKQYVDAGISPRAFFQPYRQEIGRMLGRAADSVDVMNDPKFSKILDFVDDKGQRRPMTISETQQYVRGLEEWRHTGEANNKAVEVATFLGQKFGMIA